MSIEIDLQEFILEGNFGPITIGDSYEKVTSILKAEDSTDNYYNPPYSKLLYYGSLELGFVLDYDDVFRVNYIGFEGGFGRYEPLELSGPLRFDKRSRRVFYGMSEKQFFWLFPELRRKMKLVHEEEILEDGVKTYESSTFVHLYFSNYHYERHSTMAFRLESIMFGKYTPSSGAAQ